MESQKQRREGLDSSVKVMDESDFWSYMKMANEKTDSRGFSVHTVTSANDE